MLGISAEMLTDAKGKSSLTRVIIIDLLYLFTLDRIVTNYDFKTGLRQMKAY